MSYQAFLEQKQFNDIQSGFELDIDSIIVNPASDKQLKDFQQV